MVAIPSPEAFAKAKSLFGEEANFSSRRRSMLWPTMYLKSPGTFRFRVFFIGGNGIDNPDPLVGCKNPNVGLESMRIWT